MAKAESEWLAPRWAGYPKHFPRYNEDWDDVVQQTGRPRGIATYHPDLSQGDIERLEMECVAGHGIELPRPKDHVRAFFRELDFEVGASQGDRTTFAYVEYHTSGVVHGYPITRRELIAKGMQA